MYKGLDKKSALYLERLLRDQTEETKTKFEAGVKEHGGFILDLGILKLAEEAKKEHIDGYVYSHALERLLRILLEDPVVQDRLKELFPNGRAG